MNRAFKTQFHNGEPDQKTIVTLSCTVNNGKRFHALNKTGRKHLVENITRFEKSLAAFKKEIIDTKS